MLKCLNSYEAVMLLSQAPFLDLNLSITNAIVSFKIYDKRDEFNFEIVNFPFIDGDPRLPSYTGGHQRNYREIALT